MKKKLLSVLLTTVMVLSLAACGGGGSADSGSSEGDGAAKEGSNKLTIWAWDQNFNIRSMQIAAEQYAKDHEGFEVEIIETSSDDCQTKLTTCANSGDYSTMPDISLMQDNSYQKFLASYPEAFTDLTDCGINWSDFPELKQSFSTLDGKHYGVPFDNGCVIGIYRTDILSEAGYTADDLTNITWSRFIEIGQDVYEKTGKYLLSTMADGDTLLMMIQSCADGPFDADGNVNIVGNQVVEKCVDLYIEMVKKNVILVVNNWDDYIKTITTGQTAGVVNGDWIMATLMATEDQKGLWEVTTMPRVDDIETATNYANNGGSSWYITANCKQVDLAMDFLKSTFGSSTEFYDAILPETSAIACYLPAVESEGYQTPVEFFNNDTVFAKALEFSGSIPKCYDSAYHYESREVINVAAQKMMDGIDRDTAFKEAQDDLAFRMESQ